ncbi:MAG TPA: GNAT family N-acetyltransferase [Bacteroidales bacterium]|nr:GNAT family N-acetyltransferase [Bacteroidales bacterium]HNZ44220.1 GNAT family N-acetyltransferase [Bacteroidales bacterium]HOH83287.1 GNAT family N-acetyltransferase [Bacteroidales bacterium]HPB25585.1 GNAT family N-acetyltransferase [Bacteroidales bacterium]HPI29873.1 GNAT family N-acetyltransferase [Bacteroidales bacterium]
MIRLLTPDDFDAWMALAAEVEPLFGPMTTMPAFKEAISNCVKYKNAYGISFKNEILAGIVAVDREKNEIVWLAVSQKYQGKKLGDKLVKKCIEEMADRGDIFVQTFAENIAAGIPARRIYERNGFTDLMKAGKNPAGIDTVIMVKRKKT